MRMERVVEFHDLTNRCMVSDVLNNIVYTHVYIVFIVYCIYMII